MQGEIISPSDWVWALGSLAQVHRIPFSAELALKSFPPPYSSANLIDAARKLGLKAKLSRAQGREFSRLPLPCVAFLKADTPGVEGSTSASASGDSAPSERPASNAEPAGASSAAASSAAASSPTALPAVKLILILRADAERVLTIGPGAQAPVVLMIADFDARATGDILLVAQEAPAVKDADAAAASVSLFGFRWFMPEIFKHKRVWRDVLLASLAIQLVGLTTPLLTQVVIDKVVVHYTMSTLIVIGVALLMFLVFSALMTWARQYLVLHTGNRIDAVLAARLFAHIFRLPIPYFEHRPTGVLVSRVQAVETIREFVSSAAVTLVLDLPFMVIFLAIMFWYSVTLTLITLALLGLIVALSLAIAPLFRERLNQQFLLGARNQAFLTEYLAGIETVKSLQMEPQLERRFGDFLAAYLRSGLQTKQLANTYNTIANALEQLLTVAVLCAGAWLVMTSTAFTIGMLVAFQMFASRLSQPLLRLVGLWQQFQQAAISVKRLGDILNAPTEPYAVIPSREGQKKAQARVEFKNIAFRYSPERPYLYRNLNLALRPGACVALMGPSGSGKSTLAKLLQGFYQPTEGQILLDGQDIRTLSANELRSHFGVVPQETTLFSGTLHDNLAVANPHASFQDVVRVCKMAEIHAAIEALPQGYQTEIGERGVGLSGGQKQRIAIARALLKRPRLLIFDEATSSLDPETAEHFAKTVNALKGQVTMLFIAHQIPRGLQLDEVVTLGTNGEPKPDAARPDASRPEATRNSSPLAVVKGEKE